MPEFPSAAPDPRWVPLSDWEFDHAAHLATDRRLWSRRHGLVERASMNGDRWLKDVRGAQAELAVAKLLDLYHCPDPTWERGKPDLVCGHEVRWGAKHDYHLPVHVYDVDDRRVFLVTGGDNQRFLVHGWMLVRDAKTIDPTWFHAMGKDTTEEFWVPQKALRPMAALLPVEAW